MKREQAAETLAYLHAHVHAVHTGLQALLDLLADSPADKTVRAACLLQLLLPLADEASQAEPLPRMLMAA